MPHLAVYVDTTKIENVSSIYENINHMHYEAHKGMGLVALIITDLLGRVIYCEFDGNGAAHDINFYRSSRFFQQLDPVSHIDDDESLIGDHHFTGNVVNRPNSREIVNSFTLLELNQMSGAEREEAKDYNNSVNISRCIVENQNKGGKKFKVVGNNNSCRKPLKTSEGKIVQTIQACFLLQATIYYDVKKTRLWQQYGSVTTWVEWS